MSVVDLGSRDQRTEFERTPPQDVDAEQSVLGGMLLSKDAIADVVEVLRAHDFYRPQHQTIYESIIDLYGRGEPADPVTVAAELTRQGVIAKVGGAPYLHTLVSSVPTAANAGYYARIVQERAILRRLVEAGTRIVQLGYASDGGDVDDLVDRAQQAVYDVTERRTSEDYIRLEDVMQSALDEIEAIGSRGGEMVGVPTGFADLDDLTNGLHPGQMIVVAARPAIGKCLAGETLVADGATGALVPIAEFVARGAAGEPLAVRTLAADGTFRVVTPAAYLYNGRRPVHELSTALGRTVRATPNHPMLTPHGWVPLEQLRAGDLVAAPRPLVPAQLPVALTSVPVAASARQMLSPTTLATAQVQWDCVTELEPAGIADVYDLAVPESHNFVAADLVVHNSTLGLDFARSASIKHQLTSVIFSLEMSRTEITMRLLSAEARVPLHHMRSGKMTDEDWARLARRMGEVAEAPLFIDDSPNMSMMEIRAKARRLKQRHDLRLVVVDYMQLMSSAKRVESRQQEVAEMSRALKLLAKELEVPVVAISQLNRGPEQRTDKKPQLSDLRESGCLTGDTRLLRADTGAEVTLAELLETGQREVPVWSVDDRLRLVARPLTHAFATGTRATFRLRLASGREVSATANHQFLTHHGWRRLDLLSVGDRLATPRVVPHADTTSSWTDDEFVILAHLLGDGCVARSPIYYCSADPANLDAVAEAAVRRFAVGVRRTPGRGVTYLHFPMIDRPTHGVRSPLYAWLDDLRLLGCRSYEKFVPDEMFRADDRQLALFLRHLWATDGSVTVSRSGAVRVYYATTSRRLADQLQTLLLRFDVRTRVRRARATKPQHKPGYTVDVSGVDDQRRFLTQVGVHGARSAQVAAALHRLAGVRANTNVDTIPKQVWAEVKAAMREQHVSARTLQAAVETPYCGSTFYKTAPSCGRLARIAEVLNSAALELVATSDVFWDSVVAIEPLGEQPVYDATVLGTHNFIANGVVAHNSIEQDADMVILLHREDAYEKESPRAGEADLVVAKHRNGPTATVTVAFQGHYSRFVDMSPS